MGLIIVVTGTSTWDVSEGRHILPGIRPMLRCMSHPRTKWRYLQQIYLVRVVYPCLHSQVTQ